MCPCHPYLGVVITACHGLLLRSCFVKLMAVYCHVNYACNVTKHVTASFMSCMFMQSLTCKHIIQGHCLASKQVTTQGSEGLLCTAMQCSGLCTCSSTECCPRICPRACFTSSRRSWQPVPPSGCSSSWPHWPVCCPDTFGVSSERETALSILHAAAHSCCSAAVCHGPGPAHSYCCPALLLWVSFGRITALHELLCGPSLGLASSSVVMHRCPLVCLTIAVLWRSKLDHLSIAVGVACKCEACSKATKASGITLFPDFLKE